MKKPLLHLAQRIIGVPLLITQSKLDVIMSAIGPRLSEGWIDDEELKLLGADGAAEPVKPRASYANATWSNDGEYAVTRNGTAIIPIHGTLVRRAGWLDAFSGMRSYESIRQDLALALRDEEVSRILLDIDSGGGEVNDCFDLCDVIYQARKKKPIYAFANDYAFSAAYAIGSSAQQLNVTRVGGVGSIGVICVHCDQSEFDAKIGVKYTAIFAGKHKNDFSAHEPLNKSVQSDAKREIDRIDGMFDLIVARNRGLSVEQVDAMEAALFYGAEGVTAGLADAVSTFDEFLASIDVPSGQSSISGRTLAASAGDAVAESLASALGLPAAQIAADLSSVQYQAAASAIPKGESMPNEEDQEAKAADKEMPACETEQEPDPEDPDEQQETEDEGEKEPTMEANTETTAPVATGQKPTTSAADAKQISKMCTLAGRADLINQFLEDGLTAESALDQLTAERVKDQPKINSARRTAAPGAVNAIAEIEAAARTRAESGGITKHQAFREALLANPGAYTEYLRANPQLDGGLTANQFAAFSQ